MIESIAASKFMQLSPIGERGWGAKGTSGGSVSAGRGSGMLESGQISLGILVRIG